jgi:small-conductance mechanosensitive channel
MLTKQEWCLLVLAGCMFAEALVAVVMVGVWLKMHRPVTFGLALCSACIVAVVCLAMQWAREWRAWRRDRWMERQGLYLCPHCEKVMTLGEYLAHRCQERRRP